MGRKKNKTEQKQLAVSAAPAKIPKQPSQESSVEDELCKLSSSNQTEIVLEKDDAMLPHGNVMKSTHLKEAGNTTEDWQNDKDDASLAKMLLRLKSNSQNPQESHDVDEDLTSESISRIPLEWSVQRKDAELRKIGQSSLKISRVRDVWNALSNEKKRSFLEVSVHDLIVHHAARSDKLAVELLTEAISFAKSNKTWASWICFPCGEKFTDEESHMIHVSFHIGDFSSKLQPYIPKQVDRSWADMLVNGCWKPFDSLAVVKILDSQKVSQSPRTVGYFDVGIHVEGSKNDHFSETSVQAVHVDLEARIVDNEVSVESGQGSSCPTSDLVDGDEKQVEAGSFTREWPLCDDTERSGLLETIHAMFLLLLNLQYLTRIHMMKVIKNTMNCLKKLAPGFEPLAHGLDKTHACICLLDAPNLRKLLGFLEELVHYITPHEDDASSVNPPVTDVSQGIALSDDLSHLILNKFLSTVGIISTAENAISVDCSTALVLPKDGVVGREDFVSWIYTSSYIGEPKSWIHLRGEKSDQGVKIFESLNKIFDQIQNLLMEKRKNLLCTKALVVTELYCVKQHSKTCSDTKYVAPSLEAILRNRHEELPEEDCSFQRDVIALVLKEAQALDGTQFMPRKTSRLSDWISSLNGDSRIEGHLSDRSIALGIQEQEFKFSHELGIIDVRIRQKILDMTRLKRKLAAISAFDYQEIIFFHVKRFLQEHLEVLADREAEMKSEAAREALLAELELEEKNNIKKGHNNSKKAKEKLNKRNKKKDHRRANDLKGTGDKSISSYQENAEQNPLPDPTDAEVSQREESVVTENDHNLKIQEEDCGHETQLKAVERKIKETLDYEREIENEAKHKQITEKYMTGGRLFVESVTEEPAMDAESGTGNQDTCKELQGCKKVSSEGDHCPVSLKEIGFLGFSSLQAPLPRVIQNTDLTFGSITPDVLQTLNVENAPFSCQERPQEPHSDMNLLVGCRSPKDSLNQHAISAKKNPAPDDQNPGNSNTKALEPSGDEEYDDERFQADLQQAIKESIDSFEAQKEKISAKRTDDGRDSGKIVAANIEKRRSDALRTGLQNDTDDNCFIDVIMQSLWRIRRFREEFSRISKSLHLHVGDPCIVCALHDIFTAFSMASTETPRKAVSLTDLKNRLNRFYPNDQSFEVEKLNAAAEVLIAIFNCLHQSFTSPSGSNPSATVSKEKKISCWDCSSEDCIAHHLFGMDIIERITCRSCTMESRCQKYTSFVHFVNASELRKMQTTSADRSLDELLKHVKMNNHHACNPERGGCGKRNYIQHIRATAPHVFIAVLEENTLESADDMSELVGINAELDIGAISCSVDQRNRYCVISMICYNKQLYSSFAYSLELDLWVLYGDTTVKAIGGWDELLVMINREKLRPLVLFFESVIRYSEKKPSLLTN